MKTPIYATPAVKGLKHIILLQYRHMNLLFSSMYRLHFEIIFKKEDLHY